MHCQDVSSFGKAPVKMCRLWAGGRVCVFSFYFCPKCIVCVCVWPCVWPCVCVCVRTLVCMCVIPRRQYSTFKVTEGSTATE